MLHDVDGRDKPGHGVVEDGRGLDEGDEKIDDVQIREGPAYITE